MNELIADSGAPVESQGQIIGVMTGRREFQTLCEVFALHGVYRVVCAASDAGINYLESEYDTNSMAREIIAELGAAHSACYVLAANTGSVVFKATLAVDDITSMIALARSLGAINVMEVGYGSTFCDDSSSWDPICHPTVAAPGSQT